MVRKLDQEDTPVMVCFECNNPLYYLEQVPKIQDDIDASHFRPVHPDIPQPQNGDVALCAYCNANPFEMTRYGVRIHTLEGGTYPNTYPSEE